MTARQLIKTVRNQKAFTLIELLVVIGILAILLAITLIAINPAKQFNAANDTKRRSDINEILNAIDQYAVDNHGNLPNGLSNATCGDPTAPTPGVPCELQGAGGTPVPSGEIDLCSTLVTTYIAGFPEDPNNLNGAPVTDCTKAYDSGYKVYVAAGANSRVTVQATTNSGPITVTR